MFAVVEYYESVGSEDDDNSHTCLAHTEQLDRARAELRAAKQLGYDLRTEFYSYDVIEFKGECPNCGRSFEY